MLIPVGTDAPVYHRPLGTMGLILANVVTFAITQGGYQHSGWLLTFGDGWHPTEWISSAFLHFGPMHLIGNMIFLWAYGLIIEGKLGTPRFLTLYAILCACDGCLTQSLMLFSDRTGGAGGASGVIFALMAIALIWAPCNTFEVYWIYRPFGMMFSRAVEMEVRVFMFSGWYLGLNLFFAWLRGFSMSTPVLHLLGALCGLPFGIYLLRAGWVDCEGWDLFTKWREARTAPSLHPRQLLDTNESRPILRASREDLLRKFRTLAANGQFPAAARAQQELLAAQGRFQQSDIPLLRQCINQLKTDRMWNELAAMLRDAYLPLDPPDTVRAQMMLAEVLIKHLHQPRSALRSVESLDSESLTPELTTTLRKLRLAAEEQIESGVMEILKPEPAGR